MSSQRPKPGFHHKEIYDQFTTKPVNLVWTKPGLVSTPFNLSTIHGFPRAIGPSGDGKSDRKIHGERVDRN